MVSRRLVAVFVIAAFAVVLAAVLARGPSSTSGSSKARGLQHLAALEGGGRDDSGGEAAEAYSDRAFPMDDISIAQIQGAISANNAVNARGAKLGSKWDFLGPRRSTSIGSERRRSRHRHSGRAALPRSRSTRSASRRSARSTSAQPAAVCGARRTRSLRTRRGSSSRTGSRRTRSARSPSTRTTRPARRSTSAQGEANASGDSEAGVGLYRTTDDGAHWSPVPGAAAISNLRAIGGTAIEPGDPSHIAIATRAGVRGLGSNSTSTGTVAAQSPATGIWETHDGGANWALTRAGTAYEVRFDPGNPNVLYAAIGLVGITRSTNDGAWETIFSRPPERPVHVLPGR
jgi:hypothetical protein